MAREERDLDMDFDFALGRAKPRVQNRDHRDGRYTYDGDMSRLCVCGHTLGQHAAGAPHECFCHTYEKGRPEHADCNCPKFRPKK